MIKFLPLLLIVFSVSVLAQEIDEIIEAEQNSEDTLKQTEAVEDFGSLKIKKISELSKLVPFRDIAMIQRKYLPKTQRFELYPNIGLVLNNAFFNQSIGGLRFAYNFTEKWAVEVSYLVLNESKKQVSKDLLKQSGVSTTPVVAPTGYMGASAKWTPIYGKKAKFNTKIIPFDMYFTFGGGSITTDQDTSPTAINIGTGQSFALNKNFALRWDVSSYFYSSETTVDGGTSGSYTNIILGLGVSFYFPGATYR